MTKKTFSRVYVLANGSRPAHNIANECNVKPANFIYVNNEKIITYANGSLFLFDDSFKKHKNYCKIKDVLDRLEETTILSVDEFKNNISYNE